MRKLVMFIAVFAFVFATAFISAPNTAEAAGKVHVVSKGESLYEIASWYGTTVGAIKQANNHWSDTIKPGQKLVIPSGSPSTSGNKVHVVSKGESLYEIASWYGTTVGAIKQANNYWSDTIKPGQKLVIPSGSPSTSGNKVHVVSKGESLYEIASWYGTTVGAIKQANNYWSDTIKPGQKLVIPSGGSAEYRNSSMALPSRDWSSRLSRNDIYLLAKLIYAEARGEVYEGQVAVGAVVLNRVASSDFPNTVAGVIYQPLAFTAVNDGQMYLEPNSTALKAAEDAAGGWDPSGGALFYYNPAKAQSKWIWSRPIIKKIGNHVFAK